MFEIASEKFTGPLELLLQLIETEELSISEVSLAHVAESYLKHIEVHEPPADELADFLIIATRLLLIKSRTILPDKVEEEEDVSMLALQLKMYKEFVDLSAHIAKQFDSGSEMFAREKVEVILQTELVISEGLNVSVLEDAFARLVKALEPFFKLQQVAMERVISVKERLKEIHDFVLTRARFTFHDILGSGKTKTDVVVNFLALLELIKQRVVQTVQSDAFSDIEIKRIE